MLKIENRIGNIKTLSRLECLQLDLWHVYLKLPEEKRKIIIEKLKKKINTKIKKMEV